MKVKIPKWLKPFFLLILIILSVAVIWNQKTGQNRSNTDPPESLLQNALEESSGTRSSSVKVQNAVIPDHAAISIMSEMLQTELVEAESVDKDVIKPICVKELPLHDLYAVSGQMVRFSVCHPDTANYIWEYYDMSSREWLPAANGHIGEETDRSGGIIAYADFEAPQDDPELLIRCMYETAGTEETISEMAFLKVLPQKIVQVVLAEENMRADAGECLASCDVMVEVTYADNTKETLDGLNGLYFMESEVETESAGFTFSNGVLTERKVQTVQNYYRQYHVVSSGEERVSLAYIPDTESPPLQLSGIVTGTDEEPPEISMVDILGRESIPDEEGNISLTVMITAEDNVTPYPRLQYAVIQERGDTVDEDVDTGKIADDDWIDSPRFTVALQENNACFLCCRDQAGNVSIRRLDPSGGPQVPETEPEKTENDMQAPVIRNIYVEED